MGWLLFGLTVFALAALGFEAVRGRRQQAHLREQLGHATHELEALQHAFSRFAPAEVVEDIIARGVSTRPEEKTVTVLFADLQGFTALAGGLPPERLVALLNGWLACTSEAIAAHRGHVAKFLGDGVLALFGALDANPWQTNDAVHAALAMRTALADYNRTLGADLPALRMGIGIHRGPVVAGVIGTRELVEYGVIGATVNVASRVEQLTRVHPADVLVTADVRAALDPRFRLREMPPASVKGVVEPIVAWAVDAFDG
jgi:adenylate cyclase